MRHLDLDVRSQHWLVFEWETIKEVQNYYAEEDNGKSPVCPLLEITCEFPPAKKDTPLGIADDSKIVTSSPYCLQPIGSRLEAGPL